MEGFDWDRLWELDGAAEFGAENAFASAVDAVCFSIFDKRLSNSLFEDTELTEFVELFGAKAEAETGAGAEPKVKDRADPEAEEEEEEEEEPKSQERPDETAGFGAGFTSSSFTSSSFTATC